MRPVTRWAIIAFVCFLAVAFGLAKRLLPRFPPEIDNSVGDFRTWSPTPSEVARQVGTGPDGHIGDQRHAVFARLIQDRFRDHQVPVGVRFVTAGRIKLMCGALLSRADMQRIAEAVLTEATDLFKKSYTLDLFETNALASRRIAELNKAGPQFLFLPVVDKPSNTPVHYSDEIVSVLPRDGIPSVFDPQFVPAAAATIDSAAQVLGVSLNGATHVYSLGLLDRHEIVNDKIGGHEIVVSWCSLCHSACVYYSTIGGRVLTFAISGKLWNNAMVMYDRETNTLWSQFSGEAIQGKLKGARLRRVTSARLANWSAWKSANANVAVLSVGGKQDGVDWAANRYASNAREVGVLPIRKPDNRAPAKELILGLEVSGNSKAYRLASLPANKLLVDQIGGVKTIVWHDSASGTSSAYRSPGGGSLNINGSAIVGNGGKWDALTGHSLVGGRNLAEIPMSYAYWFAWSSFHPDTLLM